MYGFDQNYESEGYNCIVPSLTCSTTSIYENKHQETSCTKTTYTAATPYYYCSQGTLSGTTCTYDCSTTYNYYEYVVKITYYKAS